MNATANKHPLVQQGHGWWIYERHIESDDYPLVSELSEPTLDKTGTYNTEIVYQEVAVFTTDSKMVAQTLNGTEVPLEQVSLKEPTNLQRVDPYEEP